MKCWPVNIVDHSPSVEAADVGTQSLERSQTPTMKYEFASRAWFAALHAILSERAAAAAKTEPDLRLSTCEVFTNPPNHLLAPGERQLAWHCRIRGSAVEFALTEVDDAETKIIGDYTTLVPLARYVTHGDAAREVELEGLLKQAVAAGKINVVRRSTRPSPLGSVHDAICMLTA